MIDRQDLDAFLAHRSLVFLGASRDGRKFGNLLLKALRDHGTTLYPIHPQAPSLEGLPCLSSLEGVPAEVSGAVLVLKPQAVLETLPELARAGIRSVWVQQGGQSPAAAERAQELGIRLIQGHCLLMFLPGAAWLHRFHHRVAAWVGQVPA